MELFTMKLDKLRIMIMSYNGHVIGVYICGLGLIFFFFSKVHAIAPSEDNQLIEHLEELIQELGPLSEEDLEEEAVDEEDVENELQRESDEESNEEEMDTS